MVVANLRTNIMDSRGLDSMTHLNSKGWNSHVHRGFPGKFEASNLSRDNVSREIGRNALIANCNDRRPVHMQRHFDVASVNSR